MMFLFLFVQFCCVCCSFIIIVLCCCLLLKWNRKIVIKTNEIRKKHRKCTPNMHSNNILTAWAFRCEYKQKVERAKCSIEMNEWEARLRTWNRIFASSAMEWSMIHFNASTRIKSNWIFISIRASSSPLQYARNILDVPDGAILCTIFLTSKVIAEVEFYSQQWPNTPSRDYL